MDFKDFCEALRIYLQNGGGSLGVKAFAQNKLKAEMDVVVAAEEKK